jgi:hypothetical protein
MSIYGKISLDLDEFYFGSIGGCHGEDRVVSQLTKYRNTLNSLSIKKSNEFSL